MKYFLAKITISLRSGILDVQGKAVERALNSIEFPMLSNVRIGKYVELTVNAEDSDQAYSLVKAACEKLIANPIIEDFNIKLEEK
jgi:phosphoribosylformylglycinamidine synthase subunit PurS